MDIDIDIEGLLLEFTDKGGFRKEVEEVREWLEGLKESDPEGYLRTFNTEGLPKEGYIYEGA